MTRPTTDTRGLATGGRRVRVQRACNGCGTYIGDATDAEIDACVNGGRLPDVRNECPTCTPGGAPCPVKS